MIEEEMDSSPTAFTKARNSLMEHFAKRIASYIGGMLVAAMMAIFSSCTAHKVTEAKKEASDINSGTNWIGKTLYDQHSEIWESKDEIKRLNTIINDLTNQFAELRKNQK